MISTITENMFIDAFKSIRPNNFSYEGLRALFEYFEELENSCDDNIELDVIAICCEWCEDTLVSTLDNCNLTSPDELRESTYVIKLDNGRILYQAF